MTVKRATTTMLLGVVALIIGCACADMNSPNVDDEFSRLHELEECVNKFESSVRLALTGSPETESIAEAVRWVSGRLPDNVEEALERAGIAMSEEVDPTSWSELASDRDRLMSRLHYHQFRELSQLREYRDGGCALVLTEELGNVLYRALNLDEGDLAEAFDQLGLHDSYEIGNAFLGMLALYMGGVDYRESWFSRSVQ